MSKNLSFCMIVALMILAAGAAHAAPAPLPRQEPKNEVVFEAGTKERARLALIYLRSQMFGLALLEEESARKQLTHGEASRRADALVKQLSVTADGTQVQLRVIGPEAKAILSAAVERLTGTAAESKDREKQALAAEQRLEAAVYLKKIHRLREQRPNKETDAMLAVAEAWVAKFEFADRPLKVHRQPRSR
jgi:hypothetical protein